MNALLVEDDGSLAYNLSKLLKKRAGINCLHCPNSAMAISMLESSEYNILLLDINLPDMNGNTVIEHIRKHSNNRIKSLPILVISSDDSPNDKVKSLQLGADDYMSKPFHVSELICRMSLLVRRCNGHSYHIVRTGAMAVNTNTKKVYINNKCVHLTTKEYELTELLILKIDTSLKKESIISFLYNGNIPGLKVIDVLVCKLRKKFEQFDKVRDYIATEWGMGYRMQKFEIDTGNTIDGEIKAESFTKISEQNITINTISTYAN